HTRFSRVWSSDVCSSDLCNMVLARWRVKNASLTAWRGRDQRPPLTPESLGLTSSLEMSRPDRTIILDARALSRALQRMAVEVLEIGRASCRERVGASVWR